MMQVMHFLCDAGDALFASVSAILHCNNDEVCLQICSWQLGMLWTGLWLLWQAKGHVTYTTQDIV
jgi:hypothetical protein